MSMGNYLCVHTECETAMATNQSSVGMNHPTVVPSNFESEDSLCAECGRQLAEH